MNNKFFGFVGIVFGIVGIGYSISTLEKMNKIHDIVEKATDDLSKSIDIDVSNAIIERAVDKAVNEEVGNAVRRAAEKAVSEIKSDIHAQVRMAVTSAYVDVKDSVAKELDRQVDKVDISKIKEEVIERAKEAAAEKFNENLDDILEKFNDDLDNVNKIYKSIARSISKHDDRELVFRI